MKKHYTLFLVTLALLIGQLTNAQEGQKNYINYQGVARNAANELMTGESLTIGIALRFGSAVATPGYSENHSVTTDANGVFSLRIGNGTATGGDYGSLSWGHDAVFVTVSLNGSEVGTTELMAVPYAISSGDAKQTAGEVPYDNTTSGLSATDTQTAIDELASGSTVDADADPTNELQMLDFNTTTNELSLSDGNSVTIPSGGTDADADPTNELQHLSLDGTLLKISDGSGVDLGPVIPPGGTDNQNLILTGDILSIESGSGNVDLSTYIEDADADPNNEVDVTAQTGILLGDGTAVSGLVGTSDGQVPKWNSGTGSWVAGVDATSGGGTGTPTGLEALDEGGGTGWRLIGRDPNNYGPIGLDATDLSTSNVASTDNGATGNYATAMGEETKASGIRSTAMGYRSQSSGSVSFAVGEETVASGEFAVALGDRTQAIEQSSTAFGAGTTASGTHSTAMGSATTASGRAATAIGDGTQAESLASLAVGSYNVGGGDAFVWQPNDPLFEIGNGSATTRKNALTVLKSGKMGIGTNAPSSFLDIATDGNQWNLSSTEGDFRIGDAVHRIKIGVATAGAGAGDARIRVEGGTDRMMLGGGTNDVLTITDQNVGVGTITPSVEFDVVGTVRSSDLVGVGERNVVADANGNLIIGAGGGGTTPTGLEALDEGSGIGWRLIGKDPTRYGNIGLNATDLSSGDHGSSTHGATGEVATAMGQGTTASGPWSTAMGYYTISSDTGSTAMGVETNASGYASTTMGDGASASGSVATAMGGSTGAAGSYATAMGQGTRADAYISTAIGSFNVGGGDAEAWQPSDPLFEIGNGTFATRSNALTVLKNGNVGIGTETPSIEMDVEGGIRSSDLAGVGERNVVADASGNLVIGAGGGGGSIWTQNGSNINYNGGNVGIGTDTPVVPLEINTATERQLVLTSSQNNNYMQFITPSGFIGYSGVWSGDNDLDFGTTSANTTGKVHLTTGAVPKLTVAANGHVGIGNTDPDEDLVVGSNLGSGWAIPAATIGNSTGGAIQVGNQTVKFSASASSTFDRTRLIASDANGFGQGIVEMRTRQLNVGRSPGENTTRTYPLRVVQNIAGEGGNYGINLINGNDSAANWEFYVGSLAANNGNLALYFNNSNRGSFDAASGNYSATSDARLKTGIKEVSSVLRKMLQLHPKQYSYRGKTNKTYNGFLAQDLLKVFPEVVSSIREKNGSGEILMVDYNQLIALTVKSMQEQQVIIEQQNEMIFDLNQRMLKLEAVINN